MRDRCCKRGEPRSEHRESVHDRDQSACVPQCGWGEGVKSKVNNAFTGLTCGRCVTGH